MAKPYFASLGDNQLRGSKNRARVGGSGFTVFAWQNKPILFARQISHRSPTPVNNVVPIHPMDTPYPVEIITPLAATMGEITLEFYDIYGSQIWERLPGLDGTGVAGSTDKPGRGPVDIVGVFKAIANAPEPIRIFKYVRPPAIRGTAMRPYTEEYHNCIVSQIIDGETIEVGTMEVLKQIVINYTHMTRGGRNDMLKKTNLGGSGAHDSNTVAPTGGYN